MRDRLQIEVTELKNARQLGGYMGVNGRPVKQDVLLRTAQLSDASVEDLSLLQHRYHVKDIIDFRTQTECCLSPDPQIPGANYHWIDLMNSGDLVPKLMKKDMTKEEEEKIGLEILQTVGEEGIFPYYAKLVSQPKGQNGYEKFFQILLQNREGAVLWHCTQGKDRTGIAAVLLLSALGVDRDTILSDYEKTNLFFANQIEEYAKQMEKKLGVCFDEGKAKIQLLVGVDVNTIERLFAFVEETYGSMEQYLENVLGLSPTKMKLLQDRYLEKE